MAEEKYGLVEDIDKFIETKGTEGVQEPVAPEKVDPPKVDPPAPAKTDPPKVDPVVEFKVEENEAYIALLAKNKELEAREMPEALNPKLKEIQDWAKRTNRPIEEYTKFQADPKDLADLDVVRKIQQLQNPDLSPEELDFYIKDNFISDKDVDTDEEIMRKNIKLKKEVTSGRKNLEDQRLVFDTVQDSSLTTEQKESIEFANKTRTETEESNKSREADVKALKSVIGKTDKISFELAEGKTIDFAIPTDSKKDQEDYLNQMKRWENEDGTTNQQVMVEDSYRIRHFDEMIKLAHQQGMNDQIELSAEKNANIVKPSKQHKTVSEGKFGFVGRSHGRRKQV